MSVRQGLDALAARVSTGDFGTAREWGAAEVMVTKGDPGDRLDEFSRFSDPVVVRTPHAAELSWLFGEIRALFARGSGPGDRAPGRGSSTGSGAWLGGGGSGTGAEAATSAAREAAASGVTEQDLFASMAAQVNRVIDANSAAGGEACKKTQLMSALQYAYWVAGRLEA